MLDKQELLVRGSDYIAQHPDFELVGREDELQRLSGILLRRNANSVLLVGAGGVGCTALCMGLQAAKKDPNCPFDLVSKRFYWLDTDGLFSSGDIAVMNENYQKVLRRLSRYPDTVLIIEDMRDFIEATRNNGCTNFINALMRAVEQEKFQAILETRDSDLEMVLKCHSNVNEYYTMLDLGEPGESSLFNIVYSATRPLHTHHKISIAKEATETAIELTSKYRVREMSLSRAQPERSLNLLDRALTSYRQSAHANPPGLNELLSKLSDETLDDSERKDINDQKVALEIDWNERQEKLRNFYQDQRNGEEMLRKLEQQLHDQLALESERQQASGDSSKPKEPAKFQSFNMRSAAGGYESETVNKIRDEIKNVNEAIGRNKSAFNETADEINKDLELNADHVITEFSNLSGIPTNKLNQDERAKLLNLDKVLAERVFGQDHAIRKLANAVRVARVGLKDPRKPQASFMFLGPSGVGKTEIAKALTEALHDDERALLRFDMSEYMEKHAVAKLIGAPPGYEGYEAGGILTNAMRRNPYVVVLFDEIEKAHPDVFNVFLQVLDDGRLTDNRGLTVSFSEAIIVMTTNIGQSNFLNSSLDFSESVAETMAELDTVYRPEFLNRFNGRQNIVCFNKLDLDVIGRIAAREIDKLNFQIQNQGRDLKVVIDDNSLANICRDHYEPANGARGIPGYFATTIHPTVANTMLQSDDMSGTLEVRYDSSRKSLEINITDQDSFTSMV